MNFTLNHDGKGRLCCDWVTSSPGVVNCKELQGLMVEQGGQEIKAPSSDDKLARTLESLGVDDRLPTAVLKVELVLANGDAIELAGVDVLIKQDANAFFVTGDAEI